MAWRMPSSKPPIQEKVENIFMGKHLVIVVNFLFIAKCDEKYC
jgi:hypothetical protein